MRPVRWGSFRSAGAMDLQAPLHPLALVRFGILGVSLAMVLMPHPSSAATDAPLLRLDRADFILSDSPEPPPDSVAWRPQTLPDDWLASRPGVWGYGWYRLRFALPGEPDELYALHVPLLAGVGAVYVNGVHVGQTGTFERTASTERPAHEAPLLVPGRGLFANVPRSSLFGPNCCIRVRTRST